MKTWILLHVRDQNTFAFEITEKNIDYKIIHFADSRLSSILKINYGITSITNQISCNKRLAAWAIKLRKKWVTMNLR